MPPVEQKKALKCLGAKNLSLPKKIAAIVVAAACLIAAVAVSYAIGYQRGAKGRTVLTETAQSEQNEQTEPTEGDDIQPLEEEIISVLCCGVDNTQELTDVIMYAQFDTRSGKVNVLRIPRDTFVGSQFPTAKINAIYGHPEDGKTGIQTLTDYLRDNWKLDIDYYATIDLASVRDIVDDMGGVTMDIQQQINYLPGKVLYPGEQTLTGEQAEWIIRYRAGYANGDLGRIDAQTQFIFACLDRVHELGRLKCIPILMQHYDDVQTDMTLDKMLSVATALFEVDSDDIQMQVVPGTGTMYYSYAVYAVDEPQLVDILNESFVSSDGEFTAENMEVASVYGSGSSNRYNSSQSSSGNRYNYNNNTTGSTSSSTSSGQNSSYGSTQSNAQSEAQSEVQSEAQSEALYQYDEDGNPLYRLDENGDPVYDYDEDGNILYVYEQAEQQEKEQQEQKEKEEEQKKKEEEKNKRPSTLSQANKGHRS